MFASQMQEALFVISSAWANTKTWLCKPLSATMYVCAPQLKAEPQQALPGKQDVQAVQSTVPANQNAPQLESMTLTSIHLSNTNTIVIHSEHLSIN